MFGERCVRPPEHPFNSFTLNSKRGGGWGRERGRTWPETTAKSARPTKAAAATYRRETRLVARVCVSGSSATSPVVPEGRKNSVCDAHAEVCLGGSDDALHARDQRSGRYCAGGTTSLCVRHSSPACSERPTPPDTRHQADRHHNTTGMIEARGVLEALLVGEVFWFSVFLGPSLSSRLEG